MLRCVSDQDWQRLAGLAKAERERQGLTQEEVAAKGGPSTASLRLIEGALQTSYRSRTLRQLEDALGWERGSVWTVLEGGEPTRMATSGRTPAVTMQAEGRVMHPSIAVREHPVGLGLDDEASDLPGEDVESIRSLIHTLRRARGLE